ncbi:alpha/beta fold hydrolase [Streptomyces sp. NPDC086549]|uniref:alpha/beta fold hydrolase n=1 Tax=Streptomyces sp. NPDC086549 TaxID=3365752 RepID=UPI0038276547
MTSSAPSPTVVLVHGAFADASSWSRVVGRLSAAGVATVAAPNPLRGLTADGEYVANIAGQIEGPVLLVGHSYGGPVITYASAKADNVKGLVFVASFGVDQGVSTLGSNEGFPPAELDAALLPRTFPRDDETGTEFYIQPEHFHSVFCADLPADEAAVLAVSQRPAADAAFGEPLAVEPGWKKVPSWFIVAGADHAINPDAERAAAKRIGATVTEIDGGSHAIALSHADEVAQVVLGALREIG